MLTLTAAYGYFMVAMAELWIPKFNAPGGCSRLTQPGSPGGYCEFWRGHLFFKFLFHWIFSVSFLLLYLILTFGTWVPSWTSRYGPDDQATVSVVIALCMYIMYI